MFKGAKYEFSAGGYIMEAQGCFILGGISPGGGGGGITRGFGYWIWDQRNKMKLEIMKRDYSLEVSDSTPKYNPLELSLMEDLKGGGEVRKERSGLKSVKGV